MKISLILLTAEKITKAYTEKTLLHEIIFGINTGDKIGIIGVNGTGKSTLLKIIAGLERADSGQIVTASGVKIGYLAQNPIFEKDNTIIEHVLLDIPPHERDSKEYEGKAILTRLGIHDFDKNVLQLSGGQRRRVAIARALINPVDILVMDEPTNHIDNSMVAWLEDYLKNYRGALVMVTHDRYFLERVVNKIFEIDKGELFTYEANYSKFLELKAMREESLWATERKRQSILRTELEWLKRGVRARGTKSRSRIERIEDMQEQKAPEKQDKLEMTSLSSRLGKKIIEIDGISKSYGDKELLSNFSYNFLRDDRIGIIGENGCGKTTLLKMIMGILEPDSGTISIGETVKIGYFSQEYDEMNPKMKAIEYIREFGDKIKTVDGVLTASQLMETFLFNPTLQYSEIGRLSGGERRRLFLLRILIEAPNFLILDEPTNDLDIETLGILEDYIDNFDGTVLVVSHDRYFLDRISEKIFAFENGQIKQYIGGYTDYTALSPIFASQKTGKEKKDNKQVNDYKPAPRQPKFSYNEKREYEEIDDIISDLEEKIELAEKKIANASADYVALEEALNEKALLTLKLEEKMERWVYLNEKAQEIES